MRKVIMRERRHLAKRTKTYNGVGRGRNVVDCFSLGFSPEDNRMSRMTLVSRIDICQLWFSYGMDMQHI